MGVVKITTLSNRQYCVILDPVGGDGKPQLGQKKLVKGEKSFFLLPGERLEKGIQNVYVLGEDEGLILKAIEAFKDTDTVSGWVWFYSCSQPHTLHTKTPTRPPHSCMTYFYWYPHTHTLTHTPSHRERTACQVTDG